MIAATENINLDDRLLQLKAETSEELHAILQWWMQQMPDQEQGGFYGRTDAAGKIIKGAEKGLVLNSRILWTFSAAFIKTHRQEYLLMAERAFTYLLRYFHDPVHGGFYWSVDAAGDPLQDKKQVYGIAFAIYGLSEYYRATKTEAALEAAKELFLLIEQYSFDPVQGGYLEAFTRDWQPISDLRLSDKDANEKKTMNTHLHVLEAYSNLYKVWQDDELKIAILELLNIFREKIIDPTSHRQHLFFSETWEQRSTLVSFGHDVEAAWLLLEAAETIQNESLVNHYRQTAIAMAGMALQGMDADGGIWYEYDPVSRVYNKEKHWWPQAEAMVGFFNAYELTGNLEYFHRSVQSWNFIKEQIIDRQQGEWRWGIYEDGSAIQKEKAGFWKCPYHNSRACMEINKRITDLLNQPK